MLLAGCRCFEIANPNYQRSFEFNNFSGLDKGTREELAEVLTTEGFEIVSKLVFGSEDDDERYWSAEFLQRGILK